MVFKLILGLATKRCMRTADVRAVVCTFMFCNMFIALRRRLETLIEPFAVKARAFEDGRAVEEIYIIPRRRLSRQLLNDKSHFSQAVVQL